MPTFQSSHGSIHYTDAGAGPAILLVHGFPLDGRVWEDVASRLTPAWRVIVPDLPGFGRSMAGGPFSMDSLAASLVDLLDHLKVDKASCAGLSMGGYVLQSLYRRAAGRIERLAFVDSRANADDAAGRAARDKMIALVREKGTAGVVEQMLPKMLHPDAYTRLPDLVDRQRAIMMDCPPKTIEYACAAIRDRADFTGELSKLACPLTIVVGDGDVITPPEVARAMHAATGPRSRLHLIAGAGHMTPLERPAETAAAIGVQEK